MLNPEKQLVLTVVEGDHAAEIALIRWLINQKSGRILCKVWHFCL